MNKKPEKSTPSPRAAGGRKPPKKMSRQYLENAALYYLQRYATSIENFRRVLTRKIDRACAFHQTPPAEFHAHLDALVKRYSAVGLLNDTAFAEAKTATLRRQGRSKRDIIARLQSKGLKTADIEAALHALDAGTDKDAELSAATVFAKRKKLGVYNPRPPKDAKAVQKELAAMARAGFSYDIIRKALQTYTDDWDEMREGGADDDF